MNGPDRVREPRVSAFRSCMVVLSLPLMSVRGVACGDRHLWVVFCAAGRGRRWCEGAYQVVVAYGFNLAVARQRGHQEVALIRLKEVEIGAVRGEVESQ